MSTWKDRARGALAGDTSGLDKRMAHLEAQVESLQVAVSESQRLNERLSDLLDVVAELLVPAVDRDDERLQAALASATRVVEDKAAPAT